MVICSAASVELTDTVRNPLGYYRNTTMNSRADRDDRHGRRDRPEGERTQRDFHLHIISSPPRIYRARGAARARAASKARIANLRRTSARPS
jgi:hypothetical protein